MTRVPSWPRLMRPLFSVRVSPRLTNMNGVLFRIAPATIASGTPRSPRPPEAVSGVSGMNDSGWNGLLAEEVRDPCKRPIDQGLARLAQAARPCVEPENHEEERSLKDLDAGAAESNVGLEQITAAGDAAQQNGNGNDVDRIPPRAAY